MTQALLHVTESGKGSPVVLLHPIGTRAELWDDIIPRLTAAHRVMAVDLPGHGRSESGKEPLSIGDMVTRVVQTLRQMQAVPAHVVGLSLGGAVAQTMLLQSPEAVRSLVLCGTTSEVAAKSSDALEQRARIVEQNGMAAIIDETMARWFSPAFQARDPAAVARVRDLLLTCDPRLNAQAWRSLKGFSSVGRVTLRRPTLVINGELEAALSPETGPKLAAVMAARLVELPGAAHISPLEDAAGFATLVMDFLKDVEHSKGE